MNYPISAQHSTTSRSPPPPTSNPHLHNSAWGDSLNPLTTSEQQTTLRIAFQNANGMRTHHNWSEWTNACSFIKNSNISLFGAVKTNLFWTQETKHLLQKHSMKHLTTPRTIATSCSSHTSTSNFQPGGCLLLSSGR